MDTQAMRKRKRIDPFEEAREEAARITEVTKRMTPEEAMEKAVARRGRDMEAELAQMEADATIAKTLRLMPISNAPECNLCVDTRAKLGKPNDTYIYATRDRVRYCKCRLCGHTFKFVPKEG